MLLYAVAIIAFHDLAALEVQVGAVAGVPVAIDRRLRLEACADPPAITRAAAGLTVDCAAPAWRIFVPAPRVAPVIRRGDPVIVSARGPGFDITLDGTAEADAVPGARLGVRARAGGHLVAVVAHDGSLFAPGYNLP